MASCITAGKTQRAERSARAEGFLGTPDERVLVGSPKLSRHGPFSEELEEAGDEGVLQRMRPNPADVANDPAIWAPAPLNGTLSVSDLV